MAYIDVDEKDITNCELSTRLMGRLSHVVSGNGRYVEVGKQSSLLLGGKPFWRQGRLWLCLIVRTGTHLCILVRILYQQTISLTPSSFLSLGKVACKSGDRQLP